MCVISLAAWRRRFGPWLRILMIAITVLWALFVAYRWLSLDTPASVPQYRDVFYMGHWTAGEFGLNAERIARTHSPFGVVLRSKG